MKPGVAVELGRKDVEDIENGIFGVLKDPGVQEEIGAVSADVDAPEGTIAEEERRPYSIEYCGGASCGTCDKRHVHAGILPQRSQGPIQGSEGVLPPLLDAVGLVDKDGS